MDQASWCYVCGLVSAQRERLMTRQDILSLLDAGSEEQRHARLRSSLLFADTVAAETSESDVAASFDATVRRVAAISPDERIADLFLLARQWEGFRKSSKSKLLQQRPAVPSPEEEGPAEGEDPFAACWRGAPEDERLLPFADAARQITSGVTDGADLAGWIDQVADAHEGASLLHAAAALESPMLFGWVRTWVRLRAALSLIRTRRLGWDAEGTLSVWESAGFDEPALKEISSGEESNWPSALRQLGLPGAESALTEKEPTIHLARLIDEQVSALASESNGMPFGPEPVFAFLWALRLEAMHLRLALAAATFGIPEDRVTDELRGEHG